MSDIRKHKDTPEFVAKRNDRLIDFFRKNGFGPEEIRIIGDENTPAVLFKDQYILCCFVHNFDLKFTDSFVKGNVVKEYKLTTEPPMVRDEIIRLMQDFPAKNVYRISMQISSEKNLYLSGWNYVDTKNKEGRYPVFSMHKPKIYYEAEKAHSIAAQLNEEGYNCKII